MTTMGHKGLTLPPQISDGRFCEHCGCVLVAGMNMSMRVVYQKKKKKKVEQWEPRGRKLRISCFTCNKTTYYDLLQPQENKKGEPVIKEPFVAQWEPHSQEKKSKAKDRAKKRKKSNLSNLLSSKKEAEASKNSSLLSLDDFMKM
jgi:ribonuclease MRP protein subunit SNM1